MSNCVTSASPVILGIDPGYDRLGWAVGQKTDAGWKNIQLGCIQTDRKLEIIERYQILESELQIIINQHKPSQAAIETVFFANNTTTALKIAEVRGLIIACLLRNEIAISQYNPVKIKEAVTGNGKADKKAVAKMIEMEFKLSQHHQLDDAIDALAVLFTHQLYQRNRKFLA